ncbi:MAG: hypothetical protein ACRC12_01980 [Holosporales bacterium]
MVDGSIVRAHACAARYIKSGQKAQNFGTQQGCMPPKFMPLWMTLETSAGVKSIRSPQVSEPLGAHGSSPTRGMTATLS